ncbi:glutathione peroxidase [uncultured Deefgea sp.]|uniref:glutathione peroxidase n=1 Tax=uncultured Deefgea sp. TaxID=1304914 RepID=UPI0026361A52|nr:glutathione peroxidase [uncultured Deefgea sp.]
MQSIYDFSVTTLSGQVLPMADFRGQVLLIVNVASACGLTPQYADLQQLYQQYRERGLQVLGFPCNQFGGQEPGGATEIAQFCQLRFAVDFPMFAKVAVNGARAEPLFAYLKQQQAGFLHLGRIHWNFTKFLVDREGRVVGRFAPYQKVGALVAQVESLL